MVAELIEILKKRRMELALSYAMLSKRSRVPIATVKRMFTSSLDSASLHNVCAVAEAMGISIQGQPTESRESFLERAAEQKARQLVGIVQATSALEAQAVDMQVVSAMVKQTVHELMAGSPRRIWAQ